MKIPYGVAAFDDIRREDLYYVGKTRFIPELESKDRGYRYLVFLRPRRFGKSLLVSMLSHYYDLAEADNFDALFGGFGSTSIPPPSTTST